MKTILFVTALLTGMALFAQPQVPPASVILPEKLTHPVLVEQFYRMKGEHLFWFHPQGNDGLRKKLITLLEGSQYLGLDKSYYHYDWLKHHEYTIPADSLDAVTADRVFTDAAISFCKDVYQGGQINDWVRYDEMSQRRAGSENNYILVGLSSLTSANELDWFVHFLEPFDRDYAAVKKALNMSIDSLQQSKQVQLARTLNFMRWIKHFRLDRYVVVNTASAVVRYYDADTVRLRMKAVVGTPATPTPSFAAVCNAVVLYPYWHVPNSIAVNEILPVLKRDNSYLAKKGLQVIDQKGKVVDPATITWSRYSSRNFPYQFRQSTGCDNALGVVKFNLTDPYSVYMHDTNNKTAFFAGSRYFSHGCIRLEKPVELANEFLPGKIDNEFLESCYRDQKPVILPLTESIPVFVVYMTAEFDDDGEIRFYKDVYRLMK